MKRRRSVEHAPIPQRHRDTLFGAALGHRPGVEHAVEQDEIWLAMATGQGCTDAQHRFPNRVNMDNVCPLDEGFQSRLGLPASDGLQSAGRREDNPLNTLKIWYALQCLG